MKCVSKITIHTIKLLRNQLYNINKHVLTQIPCKFASVTAFDLLLAGAQFYSHLMNQLSLFRFLMALVTHCLNITVPKISSLLLCSTSFPIQYWVIILWINTIQPKILTALINKKDTDRWNAVTEIMNIHYNKCFIITWLYLLHTCYRHIHSLIPLACAECDDSLSFSGASSISLCYIPFPATLLHQLFFHPLSPHLAIYKASPKRYQTFVIARQWAGAGHLRWWCCVAWTLFWH